MAQDASPNTEEQLIGLGHLASGIGHHVINAFSAIVSNAEILRLTANSPDAADPNQASDTIIKTAVEASSVARRLIDFSRPITYIGEDLVPLPELVEQVVQAQRAEGPAHVQFVAELAPVPPLRGHADQLRSMLSHLILNAREALPPEGGTITLSTALDDRGWVVLDVRDTGQGMPDDQALRAVEPFFTTKPGRFGVGLPIANGIWRRHRGTLAVRSRLGEGTLVRLCVDPIEKHSLPGRK